VTVEPVAPEPAAPVVEAAAPAAVETPAAPAPEPAPAVETAPALEPTPEGLGAPVPSYEAFTWPEGFTPPKDSPALASFTEIAGKHGLSQETAQELIGLHAAEIDNLYQQVTQRQFDVFAERVADWEKEFRADPEFKNRAETALTDAKWAITRFGGTATQQKELRDALLASGLGNHKAVIRAFANVAKQFREARPTQEGRTSTAARGGPADRRYPNMGVSNGNR
jgi:hypothetical protein